MIELALKASIVAGDLQTIYAIVIFAKDMGHLIGIDEETAWFAVRATTPGMPFQLDYRVLRTLIENDVLIQFCLDESKNEESTDKSVNTASVKKEADGSMTIAPSEDGLPDKERFKTEKPTKRLDKNRLSGESFLMDSDRGDDDVLIDNKPKRSEAPTALSLVKQT